jgi:hypothetical protein
MQVASRLLELGYGVFKDITGAHAVDLIAHKDGKFVRIQVKTRLSKNGAVNFPRYTGGREVKHHLAGDEFDVMAMYVRDRNLVLFMNLSELVQNVTGVQVRLDLPKNGAKKNIRIAEVYTSFERATVRM